MSFQQEIKDLLLSEETFRFEEVALEAFRFQARENAVYREYLAAINHRVSETKTLGKIPFLPIGFFKTHKVLSSKEEPTVIFESSGTTGTTTSKHFVTDLPFYEAIAKQLFEAVYGSLSQYTILALLPSYLERNTSSLVYMVNSFLKNAKEGSGFYLNDFDSLIQQLQDTEGKKLLLGVTFALLDLAEQSPQNLTNTIIMETGGMKGRRKELLREEVHQLLQDSFSLPQVHSEYGMTELLSQCYATKGGFFKEPKSLKVMLRDPNDPFALSTNKSSGGINIVDLANIDSCCFIETMDIGRKHPKGFEVLGRFDHSDVRGCNLMVG